MKNLPLALALGLALTACNQSQTPPPPPEAASDQPAEMVAPQPATSAGMTIDSVIAGDWRSAENKARDVYRHPKETLAFFGVTPGQTVIEITPGGGWYTEILAPLLKGQGQYIGAIAADASSEYAKNSNTRLREKLGADAARYDAAQLVEFDPAAPNFGPDDSADVVVTFRNVHNWTKGGTAAGMFKGFFAVLKPGGTLGVVDHRAAMGADPAKIEGSGYLTTEAVIKLASDAGFKLEAESEINANPKDTKDHEKGVWTLPPTLALKDVDRDKYLAIGESDRMTLKFVKPAADKIFQQGTDGGAPTPAPAQ